MPANVATVQPLPQMGLVLSRWSKVCQQRHISIPLWACTIGLIEKQTPRSPRYFWQFCSHFLTQDWLKTTGKSCRRQFSRSCPQALCQAPLPEVTAPHHRAHARAHTCSSSEHRLSARLRPGHCSGAATMNLPADSSTWQWPRAEVSNF